MLVQDDHAVSSAGDEAGTASAAVQIHLLGGFQLAVAGQRLEEGAWRLRTLPIGDPWLSVPLLKGDREGVLGWVPWVPGPTADVLPAHTAPG
jgi:hypothetical protein